MAGLTYLALGDAAPPEDAPMLRAPRSAARAGALYRARVALVQAVSGADFVCWVDGGDAWDAAWPDIRAELVERMVAAGAAIGYCDETRAGVPAPAGPWTLPRSVEEPQHIHHGVVCRLAALQAIDWPAGCIHFETLAYHALARLGWVYVPRIGYHWHPTPGGAHAWADTARGIVNALAHLQGRPGVHFDADLID